MSPLLKFPTDWHKEAAMAVRDYFSNIPVVDTVLITNSCARGQAVPESDLDMAILIKPDTNTAALSSIENEWYAYPGNQPAILAFQQSSKYAHLHVDIISGKYVPTPIEPGGQVDSFEIEIGNHICYSASYGNEGSYFQYLKQKWLPYYENNLRLYRFNIIRNACQYDVDRIPLLIRRDLHFNAFDTLYTAFHKYLQLLFISKRTYPIAYNKWLKEQIVHWLNMPELFEELFSIISVSKIESGEIALNAGKLYRLLEALDPL